MREALGEAEKALALGILPVGAVIVRGNEVLARAHKTMDSAHLSHAETNVLKQVFWGDYAWSRADDLHVYTTLEPCVMCWGALQHVPITNVFYALEEPHGGCAHIAPTILPTRHRERLVMLEGGILRAEAKALFRQFLTTTKEAYWLDGNCKSFQDVVMKDVE